MKAVVIEAFGLPENLKIREFRTPEPGAGDILVHIRVAGVCHHDVLHRAGKLPGAKAGVVPGHETAGEHRCRRRGCDDACGWRSGCHLPAAVLRSMPQLPPRAARRMCRALGVPAGRHGRRVTPSSYAFQRIWEIKILHDVDRIRRCAFLRRLIGTSLRALKSVAGISKSRRYRTHHRCEWWFGSAPNPNCPRAGRPSDRSDDECSQERFSTNRWALQTSLSQRILRTPPMFGSSPASVASILLSKMWTQLCPRRFAAWARAASRSSSAMSAEGLCRYRPAC